MTRFLAAGLYVVTSASFSAGRNTLDVVADALAGGVRLFQLREKDLPIGELVALGSETRLLTDEAGAILLINDRVDVALAVGADGVHLGQDDFPIDQARKLGPDLVIGASTHNVGEAIRAQDEGASYVNIGPVFPTKTKQNAGEFIGMDGVREISKHLRIPFTVMGGIKEDHIPGLLEAGARTIAVVTAVTAADDPAAAARRLLALIRAG